jgi:predicted amidohydrolase
MKLVLVQPRLSVDPQADNLGVLSRLLEGLAPTLAASDLVLLPEHVIVGASRAQYEQGIAALARRFACHVVGGSHHEQRGATRVNRGVAADASGQIIAEYEKLRPYADERSRVQPGAQLGEFSIAGHRLLVLICADFWFSDMFYRASALPDLVLVPAHSVSRKPTPDYSRALWRHLAVARAYEFGVFVGISDWAHAVESGRLPPSGVAGLADPTRVDPPTMFRPVASSVQVYELDFAALASFRHDRQIRGFFWRAPES